MHIIKTTKIILSSFVAILISSNLLFAGNDFNEFAICIYKKDFDCVKEILARGVDVNIMNETIGITPLFTACSMSGTYEIAELLIEKGADVNIKDTRDGRTALMVAAQNAQLTVELLLKNGAEVNTRSNQGETAFTFSIYGILSESVSTSVCDILLEKGADINNQLAAGKTAGWTALMTASNKENIELVNYLISKGADVNLKADDGTSALSLAINKGNSQIIELLEANGAK